jgi:hypothetical protein
MFWTSTIKFRFPVVLECSLYVRKVQEIRSSFLHFLNFLFYNSPWESHLIKVLNYTFIDIAHVHSAEEVSVKE